MKSRDIERPGHPPSSGRKEPLTAKHAYAQAPRTLLKETAVTYIRGVTQTNAYKAASESMRSSSSSVDGADLSSWPVGTLSRLGTAEGTTPRLEIRREPADDHLRRYLQCWSSQCSPLQREEEEK
ncbi:hypothetical protein Forpi1262_v017314 [Fusarium oxysporum f. sp. raphani]|uniref:Uncharacterized protein n=1 Tax=Fusarium oxysporum f. sp. raphani TaxID=96318 RepID=A0A8J5NRQ5_FUSOX|nr:hypothetical protein Forpi1262_v017314 [Fusarium oxysporum f. sp. raphani]